MSFGSTGEPAGASLAGFLLRLMKSRSAIRLLREVDRILEGAEIERAVQELDDLLGSERYRAHAACGEPRYHERHALLELHAVLLERVRALRRRGLRAAAEEGCRALHDA